MKTEPHEPGAPDEAACLREARDCFYGLNGRKRDYGQAAAWLRRGHERGFLNCTAELAACYEGGYGVPRDDARALELARSLEGTPLAPLAWRIFAQAYGEGHGLPLDGEKAHACAKRMLDALSGPVEGMDEELRRSALLRVCATLSSLHDGACAEPYRRYAQENFEASSLPNRYALLASAELHGMVHGMAEDSPNDALQHLLNLLRKGVDAGDAMAMHLLAVLLRHLGWSHERVPELLQGAAASGQAVVFGELMMLEGLPEEEAQAAERRFWEICNRGVSRLPREGALPCLIHLERLPFIGLWEPRFGAPRFRAGGCEGEFRPLFPSLCITNESDECWRGLELRLCSADAGVDCRCALPGRLEPRTTLELDLREYEQKAGAPLGNCLHVELRSGNRFCSMSLNHSRGLSAFYPRSPLDKPPLELWWERGLFGGCVLRVGSVGRPLTGLYLCKQAHGARTPLRSLPAGAAPLRFGWREFDDHRGLKPGEAFAVCCNEYPPILACLDAR